MGSKKLETDSTGYYRFANLPPGIYTIVVKAAGFSELKREGIVIEVGHLPTVDLTLAVGAAGTVVEVSGAAPVIDVTTNTNKTNLTNDVIADIPHGYSFQSVIQFAPMARNEPLAGGSAGLTGNSGGSRRAALATVWPSVSRSAAALIRRTLTSWKAKTRRTSPAVLPMPTSPSSSFRKSR